MRENRNRQGIDFSWVRCSVGSQLRPNAAHFRRTRFPWLASAGAISRHLIPLPERARIMTTGDSTKATAKPCGQAMGSEMVDVGISTPPILKEKRGEFASTASITRQLRIS